MLVQEIVYIFELFPVQLGHALDLGCSSFPGDRVRLRLSALGLVERLPRGEGGARGGSDEEIRLLAPSHLPCLLPFA